MDERTEEERDVLKEIGNVGGGNALASLSAMLERPFALGVPECHVVAREELGNLLENPDALYTGISMTMTGAIDCVLAVLLDKQFSELIMNALDPDEPNIDVRNLTEIQKSALSEVGNIMGNSYVTAIGAMLDLHTSSSVPKIVVDEGHRVLKDFLDEHAPNLGRLFLINSAFRTGEQTLESCILLCPTDESLAAMLEKLGF